MDDLDDVRRALLERRDETRERLARLEEDHRRIVDASRDDNADDEHDPEGQTIAWDRAQTDALAAATRRELASLGSALARIDSGWDGRCESCGEPIPHERLLARPATARCVRCA